MLLRILVLLCAAGLAAEAPQLAAQGPSLPEGLEKSQPGATEKGPALPSGLGGAEPSETQAPALPSGLDDRDESKPAERTGKKAAVKDAPGLPLELDGFFELRGGLWIEDNPVQDDEPLAEARLQLGYDRRIAELLPRGQFQATVDFIYDGVEDNRDRVDLEDGEGFIDLREFWISFTPWSAADVKAGRQILTWGTGNLIFLNDLFPKDYQSFFLGRDLEYLKAPSDAVKASIYSDFVNIDIVYTPRFDADRFVDGTRLAFFDPETGRLRGEDMPLETDSPDDWFEDDEIAARIYRNLGAYELAVYGYDGFWKSPAGTDPVSGRRIFPPLSVLGASVRGTLGPGIGNAEFSWYRSEDDLDGDDPLVRNSELRFLVGYEQEIATDLTVGMQYYLEHMLEHDEYEAALPPGVAARDRNRQWVTLDVTQELMRQNQLVLSLFTFYSLGQKDAYLRPKVVYDYTDNWRFTIGGNIFFGDRETFFGQFEESSNVYASVRYSF